ncbi:MAG: hypothetical protein PHW95_05380 [Patescibacteria group bacterium]|nr:hypothetical protein [Patescibacteria group bacterium]
MAKKGRKEVIRNGSGLVVFITWALSEIKPKALQNLIGKFDFGTDVEIADTDEFTAWRRKVVIEPMTKVINVQVSYTSTAEITDGIETVCVEDAECKVFKIIDTLCRANDIPGNDAPEKKEEKKPDPGQNPGSGMQRNQGRPGGGGPPHGGGGNP